MWHKATHEQLAAYEEATRVRFVEMRRAREASGGVDGLQWMARILRALKESERETIPQSHAAGGRLRPWDERWLQAMAQAGECAGRGRQAVFDGDDEAARRHFAEAGALRTAVRDMRRRALIEALEEQERNVASYFGSTTRHAAAMMVLRRHVRTWVKPKGKLGGQTKEFNGVRHPTSQRMVFGDEAVKEALHVGLSREYRYDSEDIRYDAEAEWKRRGHAQWILRTGIPDSIARARELQSEVGDRQVDWATWEAQVLSGERQPSEDERVMYCSAPYDPSEASEVRGDIKQRKAPHPEEDLAGEAVIYAAPEFDVEFTGAANGLDDLGKDPEQWERVFTRWLYKGKGDPNDFLSYRDIALVPALAKLRERLQLRRLRVLTRVDVLQGLESRGVDMRHQSALLIDTLVYRDRRGLRTWLVAIDIRRAFPSIHRIIVLVELWRRGVRGKLLRSVWSRIKRIVYVPAVRKGVDGTPVDAGVSLPMGAVPSPRYFCLVIDSLQGEMRLLVDAEGRSVGVHIDGIYVGTLLFMDDVLALAATRQQVELMVGAVMSWCYVNRLESHAGKLAVLATRRDDVEIAEDGRSDIVGVWSPTTEDPVRKSAAVKPYVLVPKETLKYLDLLIGADVNTILRQHREVRLAITSRVIKRMISETSGLGVLTFRQRLQAWTMYARSLLEDVAGQPGMAGTQAARCENAQRRALASTLMAGIWWPAAPAYAVMLALFQMQRISTRVLCRRLGFARALSVSRLSSPGRCQLVDFFDAEAGRDRRFAAGSPTGATRKALSAVKWDWPDPDAATKAQHAVLCRQAARAAEQKYLWREVWSPASPRASARVLRAMAPTRAWAAREVLDKRTTETRVAHTAACAGSLWICSLVRIPTRGRPGAARPGGNIDDAGGEEDEDDDGEEERAVASEDGAGGEEDGEEDDGGSASERRWREEFGDGPEADDGDAERADTAGDDEGGEWDDMFMGDDDEGRAGRDTVGSAEAEYIAADAPRKYRCYACGCMTAAPDVHMLVGWFRDEPRCTAVRDVRRQFVEATDAAWAQAGEERVPARAGTYADLAARLGGARGTPAWLSEELAYCFERTWGEWAARQAWEVDAA